MVRVLTLSGTDNGFEPRTGKIKIKSGIVASSLSTKHAAFRR